MTVISRTAIAIIDAFIILFSTFWLTRGAVDTTLQFLLIAPCFLLIAMIVLCAKGYYKQHSYSFKDVYLLFECITSASAIAGIILILSGFDLLITLVLLMLNGFFIFTGILFIEILFLACRKFFRITRNVLIVGAGQDGKLIAEEIQSRPELGLKVVGFLDDNMNTIEDEDSSIPILGLTCDTEAVIKDNNVKLVIIAVKSRMDSNTLSDLVKGIPLGVKVWRMPKFYEKITHRYLVSKMTVNWLFYNCVRKKALLYAYLKRFCDIIGSILIMLVTLPLSIIAIIGIKLSDLGSVFFFQTRIGRFGQPFKMIKFRTMYQDKVEDDFDDDATEVKADDKRIMPFCKILRKFHIDEIPQMINVLRGEMSIIGPRPVREEEHYENREKLPFWDSRCWVHPGWCGWQQVNVCEPLAEERLEYDLYYIKHRHILWEFAILIQYIVKVFTGKCK